MKYILLLIIIIFFFHCAVSQTATTGKYVPPSEEKPSEIGEEKDIEKEDIESRPLWKPLHMQPIFENHLQFTDGTSEDLFNRGICLPSGSNLSQEDLDRIVSIIKKTLL